VDRAIEEPGAKSLIREVRMAMARRWDGKGGAECRNVALRRDLDGLVSRLETLRRRFPHLPEVADRVRLSGHVIDLLEPPCGAIALAAGGGARA